MVCVMRMSIRMRLGGEPAFDVRDLAVRVVQPAVQEPGGRCLAGGGVEDRRARIERAYARQQTLPGGRACRRIDQIGLGKYDAIRDGRLLDRLRLRIERR